MAIRIPFLSDVADFVRGLRNGSESVDDLAGSLDELARDGQAAGRELGDSFDDGAREAGRSAERIADDYRAAMRDVERDVDDAADKTKTSFRDALRSVSTESKRAGDDLGDNMRRGSREADTALDDVKSEAGSTARETAASFDGSADSIAGAFQEVAANAIAPLGPAGAVAGLGIALGMGAAMAALQGTAEEAAEAKQRMIDLANEIRDVGGDITQIDWATKFREYGNEIADAKSWFEPWQEAALTNFEVIDRAAREHGLEYAQLFQGMAGDTKQAAGALDELNAKIEAQRRVTDELTEAAGRGEDMQGRSATAAAKLLGELESLRDQLQENSGLTDEALELERLIGEAYDDSAAGLAEKNALLVETAELTAAAITSELDWLDALESSTAKLAENASGGFDKNTAAGRENLRTLGEVAQAALDYADAQVQAGGSTAAANATIEAGRVKILEAGTALGMTEQQALDYARSLGLIPREVDTTATAQTAAAETALTDVARGRTTSVTVTADLTEARRTIDNYRPVIVGTVRAGMKAV